MTAEELAEAVQGLLSGEKQCIVCQQWFAASYWRLTCSQDCHNDFLTNPESVKSRIHP